VNIPKLQPTITHGQVVNTTGQTITTGTYDEAVIDYPTAAETNQYCGLIPYLTDFHHRPAKATTFDASGK
jgi:hypothetical protein